MEQQRVLHKQNGLVNVVHGFEDGPGHMTLSKNKLANDVFNLRIEQDSHNTIAHAMLFCAVTKCNKVEVKVDNKMAGLKKVVNQQKGQLAKQEAELNQLQQRIARLEDQLTTLLAANRNVPKGSKIVPRRILANKDGVARTGSANPTLSKSSKKHALASLNLAPGLPSKKSKPNTGLLDTQLA